MSGMMSCLKSSKGRDDRFEDHQTKALENTLYKSHPLAWPFKNKREIDFLKAHGFFYDSGYYPVQDSAIATTLIAEKLPNKPFKYSDLVHMKVFGKPRGSLLDTDVIDGMSTNIEHANLVLPLRVLTTPADNFVLISDFCDGVQINKFMQHHEFDGALARDLFKQILSCFVHCHMKGYFHNNLTPVSICVKKGPVPQVKITDFGIPALTDMRRMQKLFDKNACFSYEAPEVLEEDTMECKTFAITGKSNVFSLGVILHEMLTGSLPFTGTRRHVLTKMANQEYVFKGNVPEKAKDLLKKMLNPDPFYRPTANDCLQHNWLGVVKVEDRKVKENSFVATCPRLLDPVMMHDAYIQTEPESIIAERKPALSDSLKCGQSRTRDQIAQICHPLNVDLHERQEYIRHKVSLMYPSDVEYTQVWCSKRPTSPRSEESGDVAVEPEPVLLESTVKRQRRPRLREIVEESRRQEALMSKVDTPKSVKQPDVEEQIIETAHCELSNARKCKDGAKADIDLEKPKEKTQTEQILPPIKAQDSVDEMTVIDLEQEILSNPLDDGTPLEDRSENEDDIPIETKEIKGKETDTNLNTSSESESESEFDKTEPEPATSDSESSASSTLEPDLNDVCGKTGSEKPEAVTNGPAPVLVQELHQKEEVHYKNNYLELSKKAQKKKMRLAEQAHKEEQKEQLRQQKAEKKLEKEQKKLLKKEAKKEKRLVRKEQKLAKKAEERERKRQAKEKKELKWQEEKQNKEMKLKEKKEKEAQKESKNEHSGLGSASANVTNEEIMSLETMHVAESNTASAPETKISTEDSKILMEKERKAVKKVAKQEKKTEMEADAKDCDRLAKEKKELKKQEKKQKKERKVEKKEEAKKGSKNDNSELVSDSKNNTDEETHTVEKNQLAITDVKSAHDETNSLKENGTQAKDKKEIKELEKQERKLEKHRKREQEKIEKHEKKALKKEEKKLKALQKEEAKSAKKELKKAKKQENGITLSKILENSTQAGTLVKKDEQMALQNSPQQPDSHENPLLEEAIAVNHASGHEYTRTPVLPFTVEDSDSDEDDIDDNHKGTMEEKLPPKKATIAWI